MARARIYPKADAKMQWWETAFARGTFTGIEKILLHTTETGGWPSYASGSMAPTLTYHPRLRAWRQHNFIDRSARALVDSTATLVRENRDNVIQIEIIAYADENLARSRGHLPVSEMTDAQLGDIADFIKWVRSEYGGPPLVAAKFLPYPQSAGASPVRMSGPTYDAFAGILGHQHAPMQSHGDPGALNVAHIMALAGAGASPSTLTGGLTMADINTILDAIAALDRKEADRYSVSTGRYQWEAGVLSGIAAKVGTPVDETAVAQQVLAGLAPQVADAIKAAVDAGVPTDELADAVVAKLGARLNPPKPAA
jgi:hypothetical protein